MSSQVISVLRLGTHMGITTEQPKPDYVRLHLDLQQKVGVVERASFQQVEMKKQLKKCGQWWGSF